MIRLIKKQYVGGSTPSDWLWKTNPAESGAKGTIFGTFYQRTTKWLIYRLLARWDTSGIPPGATILSAYIRAKVKVPRDSKAPAVFVTIPDIDPWTNAEAVNHWIDPVVGSQIVAEVPNNYNNYIWLDIPLNQAGLDHIKKGGWTYFAWISKNDYQRASLPIGAVSQQHAYLSSAYNHCRLYVTYGSEEPCPE